MPRPISKGQLLSEATDERAKLMNYLESLGDEDCTKREVVAHWTAKDVLAHLSEWHRMVMHWYQSGSAGNTPAVPAEGYNWRLLPELNQKIYETFQNEPLDTIRERFLQSDRELREMISEIPEEELFIPGLYAWMNRNTLSAYFNSCLASHYRWALREIRKGIKKVKTG